MNTFFKWKTNTIKIGAMYMYKLIAIDIDGTLINDNEEITPRVRDAIRIVREKEIKVVLVTGRPIGGVTNIIKQLGLDEEDDYVVTYNGAFVQNTNTKEIVEQNFLTYDDLVTLYSLSIDLNSPMHYFDINHIYTPSKEINKYTIYEAYANEIPLFYKPINEVAKDMQIPKIMFIDEPERLDKTIKAIPTTVKDKYMMVKSAPFFFEILHPKVSKGIALKQLAEKLSIHPENIMSIGDGDNDVSMIEFTGYGVAMANASQAVKKSADYHTLSNEEDGVAHAIEKIILETD